MNNRTLSMGYSLCMVQIEAFDNSHVCVCEWMRVNDNFLGSHTYLNT